MRFLFISTHFPKNPYSSVIGVFKRMNLFVDAIKAFGSMDMLFYVPPGVGTDSKNLFKQEQIFSDYWKTDIRLFLSQRFDYSKNSSPWQMYIAPALSFFKQTRYVRTSMPDQLKDFEKWSR